MGGYDPRKMKGKVKFKELLDCIAGAPFMINMVTRKIEIKKKENSWDKQSTKNKDSSTTVQSTENVKSCKEQSMKNEEAGEKQSTLNKKSCEEQWKRIETITI